MRSLRLLLICVIVGVAGYGLYEAWPLIAGPELALAAPVNGAVSANGIVTISGHVARITALTLDGGALLPDANGSFRKTLALPAGDAILTLSATDRFGRTVTDTRTVYVQ